MAGLDADDRPASLASSAGRLGPVKGDDAARRAGSDLEQARILLAYASLEEALDALGFAGDFPGTLIERFDGEAKMNLFSGGHYERTNLVEAVIERTRTR